MSGTGRWFRLKKSALGVTKASTRSSPGGSALKGLSVLIWGRGRGRKKDRPRGEEEGQLSRPPASSA